MTSNRFDRLSAIVASIVIAAGCAGDPGAQGPAGPAGATGATGATGPKGLDGQDGQDGSKGDPGDPGGKGDPGDKGADGAAGPKGDKGDPGADGAKGDPGVSVGDLSGVVTELSGGTAVKGATVTLEPAVTAPVTTADDGSYSFAGLPAGVYRVTASFGAFGPAEAHVSVLAGKASKTDLVLRSWKAESDACLKCHEQSDPGVVADYKAGAMAAKVSCQDCHGPDVKGGKAHNPLPTPATCAKCHPDQYRGHQSNRHSIGMQRIYEAGRFDDLPPCAASNPLGSGSVATCTQCHNVESKCDSCHSRHRFDTVEARDPGGCGTCHMGPDHPQYEIYTTSKHGIRYAQGGDASGAPTCATCHMSRKLQGKNGKYTDHDLSFGIAYGPVGGRASHLSLKRGGQLPYVVQNGVIGQNPGFDPAAPYDMAGADGKPDSAHPGDADGTLVQFTDPVEVLSARRNEMVGVCDQCHAESFGAFRLEVADGMHENVTELTHEAEDIVRALNFDKLIMPDPLNRPQNPDAPLGIVLGGAQLYRDLSKIERLYFKLYKYDAVKTWHGAYHANPDYAHWYGWAESNLTFADIADEAYMKRVDYAIKYAIANKLPAVWNVPYQGVLYEVGSMTKKYDLFPAGANMSVDSFGSGTPIVYTGLTFH